MTRVKEQSLAEEIANSLTHGIGLALSIAGLTVLVVLASLRGDAWHIVTCSIFGASLVMLYGSSTLYHACQTPTRKQIFRMLDHSCIYLLVAGTYTPITLTLMRGAWGWTLFALVWGFAVAGLSFKWICRHRFRLLSTALYVAMGWLAVIALKPMLELVPPGCLLWLLAGGLFYTFGVIFYVFDHIPYFHAVWHLFVLAGSVSHYCAVLFYVLPMQAT
jgi:hemolysin III